MKKLDRRHWRTVEELTDELRFPSAKACRSWLERENIPRVKRGRIVLVDAFDIEAALRKPDALKRVG